MAPCRWHSDNQQRPATKKKFLNDSDLIRFCGSFVLATQPEAVVPRMSDQEPECLLAGGFLKDSKRQVKPLLRPLGDWIGTIVNYN